LAAFHLTAEAEIVELAHSVILQQVLAGVQDAPPKSGD